LLLGAELQELVQELETPRDLERVEQGRVTEEATPAAAPAAQAISRRPAAAQVLAADPVRVPSPASLFRAAQTPKLKAIANPHSPSNRKVATV
jgi:hypothetical protein